MEDSAMTLGCQEEDFLGIDRFFQEAVYHNETDLNAASSIEVEIYEHESMYPTFAKIALESGNLEVAGMFEAIAREEKEHADLLRDLYPHLEITDTPETTEARRLVALETALEVETIEATRTYPAFAKLAREQGKEDVAKRFDEIVHSEQRHMQWVQRALDRLVTA
jgi:rubrerythrin